MTQNEHNTSLRRAQAILIIVGLLTFSINIYYYSYVEMEMREELAKVQIEKEMKPAVVKQLHEQMCLIGRVVYGGLAGVGILLIALGFAANKAPLLCTVAGLIVYLAALAICLAMDPERKISLVSRIYGKIPVRVDSQVDDIKPFRLLHRCGSHTLFS